MRLNPTVLNKVRIEYLNRLARFIGVEEQQNKEKLIQLIVLKLGIKEEGFPKTLFERKW